MSERLDDNDVVSMSTNENLLGTQTFKVSQIAKNLGDRIGAMINHWFDDGIECEVLRAGQVWRKGKIRIRFEFMPDEPSSDDPSLEEIMDEASDRLDQMDQRLSDSSDA